MAKDKRQLDAYTLRSAARTAAYEARRLFSVAEATSVDGLRMMHREAACEAVKIRNMLLRRAERIEAKQKRARGKR